MVLKKKRFSSFASTPLVCFCALVCYIPYIPEISDEQKVIANDSPDAPREYNTYNFSWMWPCFTKNVVKNPYIGRIGVASKEKESLLAMIYPKGSTTAILPMAKFRSKYSHSFNNARDVHPDGCKAVQMFSTNLRESGLVTHNDIHPWMRCCFIWHRWKSMEKNIWLPFGGSSLFSRAFWFVSGIVSPFHAYTSIHQRAMKACHDHVMNLDKKAPAKPPRVFLRIVVTLDGGFNHSKWCTSTTTRKFMKGQHRHLK